MSRGTEWFPPLQQMEAAPRLLSPVTALVRDALRAAEVEAMSDFLVSVWKAADNGLERHGQPTPALDAEVQQAAREAFERWHLPGPVPELRVVSLRDAVDCRLVLTRDARLCGVWASELFGPVAAAEALLEAKVAASPVPLNEAGAEHTVPLPRLDVQAHQEEGRRTQVLPLIDLDA